jgi:hypothetical protein
MSLPAASAFPSAGLNDGPLFRYDVPSSSAGRTESLLPPEAQAPDHSAPSAALVALRDRVSDGVTRPSTRRMLASMTSHASLKSSLKSASRSGTVKRIFTANQTLYTKLEAHRGPVIVLDPAGYPKYMFEFVGGEWRGFHAVGGKPLPPDKSSPASMMAHMIDTSAPGTVFTFYDLGYAGEVDRESLFVEEEEDAAIDRARDTDIARDDDPRSLEERQPLIGSGASDVSSLDDRDPLGPTWSSPR